MSGEDEQAEVMALMGAGPECPEGFTLVEDTCYLQVSSHWLRLVTCRAVIGGELVT